MADGPPHDGDRLTWLGHATVLVELDGARILTDPLLRRHPYHLVRHVPVPDLATLQALDAVLISHLHLDHLDLPSLRRLGLDVPLVVGRGAGPLVRRAGFTDVTELSAGEHTEVGGVTVVATPAAHDAHRHPRGPVAAPLGFVLDAGRRVYFAGDTGLFDGMAHLSALRLEAALLPIWGWGPALGPGHLDPIGAAEAAALIRPRIVVPIHWGTYFPRGLRWRGAMAFEGAPRRFAEATARLAPGVRVARLEPGESLRLPAGQRAGDTGPAPDGVAAPSPVGGAGDGTAGPGAPTGGNSSIV